MKKVFTVLFYLCTWLAWAQTATVNLTSEKQYIRGFGGINHPTWAGDLTVAQRNTAFGNNPNQLGMSVLRIWIDDNKNNWSRELPTAKRAIELGAIVFASPWNPPASMTEIFGANSDGTSKKRLKYDMYDDYAAHLNAFNTYMKSNGVDLYAISVQNEPDYAHDWTWWTPQEMLRFMKENAGTIQNRVIAPESFQYLKNMSDPILNDPAALANMDILGAHLYGTQVRDFPYPLFKQKGAGKELWMTEVYTDSDNDADVWPMAADVSFHMHNAMVEGEFSTYIWWYIRRRYSPIKEDGNISKRGYCFAQFSKFVRPGYIRVDATKNPTTDVYVSAYKKGDDVVIVAINRSNASKTITLSVPGTKVNTWEKYVTSGSKNLAKEATVNSSTGSFQITLDPQSTTSFVGTAPVGGAVVSLTSPGNNTVYTEGDNVTIHATATIAAGTISKVDFYTGTILLGTDATAPYTYTWNAVAAGTYSITAKASSAANAVTTSTAITIQVAKPIYQTGSAPLIDGTIDGLWNTVAAIGITKNNTGTVSSSTDLSGSWKAMWDATNLYVLVQVSDDVKRNDAGTDVYNDDNMEVYVDMFNTKATTYGVNDQQYTFRWNDATAAYEINGHSVAGIVKGISNTATGYTVEVSIPWSTMGGTAAVNSLQGFDVMINDDDDGGARDGKLAWSASGDDTWSNPSLMGTVILKGLNCTPPTATITTTTPTTFCSGSSVTLNAGTGTGYSYVWKNGTAIITGATTSSYTAHAAGSYTVVITNSGGCSSTSAATAVMVNALPAAVITAQGNTTFCQGNGNVTLHANTGTGLTYQWFNGTNSTGTGAASLSLYVSSGSFTVKVTDANGCSATSVPVTVTIHPTPATPVVTASVSYCQNETATQLTAGGTNLTWYTAATGSIGVTTAPIPQTGTIGTTNYYVSQTTNTCESARAQIAVTVNALPAAAITTTAPTSFCSGGSVTLTASAGSAYVWKNGTTTITGATNQTYTASTAGSYSVEVSNANNCKATSAAVGVTVNTLPIAAITTTETTSFCQGGSVTLTSSAGSSYVWENGTTPITGATNQTYTASTAGSYSVEVTNASGCKATSEAVTITVNALPTAAITTTAPTSFCQGGSVVLTASQGSSYKWLNGTTAITGATNQTYTTSTAGSYSVEVTNAGSCKATSEAVTVIVHGTTTWYQDIDADGAGDAAVFQSACSKPAGYVSTGGDTCPDDANKIAPGNCGCGNTESSCLDCAGIPNGTAAIDACDRCSGGTTDIVPVTDPAACTTTGASDASNVKRINVLPNPSQHAFTLLLVDVSTVHILTIEGKLVDVFEQVGTLSFGSDYAKGIYIVQVSNSRFGMQVVRVVKQ